MLNTPESCSGFPAKPMPTRRTKVNANMLGEEVLNIVQFPTATGDIMSARLLPRAEREWIAAILAGG